MTMSNILNGRPRLPLAAVPPIGTHDAGDDAAEDAEMQAEIAVEIAPTQAGATRKRQEADALQIRDANRADAISEGLRAIKRGGRDPMIVTSNDAAIMHMMFELLQRMSDQRAESIDPAFAPQRPSDPTIHAVERAMWPKGDAASPAQALQPVPATSAITVDDNNMNKSELVDIVVFLFSETADAVRVGLDDAKPQSAVWLPRSQIEISEKAVINGSLFHDLTLPRWLAEQKGLV